MKSKIILLFVFNLLFLSSCNDRTTYNVAVSTSKKMAEYKSLEKIFKKYKEKNGNKYKLNLYSDTGYQFSNNIKLLFDNKKDFDMTIINNTEFNTKDSSKVDISQLKVVMPISSRILYIAYNNNKITPKNMTELFEGKSAVILSYETDFIKKILSDFGVDLSKTNFLRTKFSADDNDFKALDKKSQDSILKIDYLKDYKNFTTLPYEIEIGFIAHNVFTKSRLYHFINTRKDFQLYSLDDYRMFNNGSYVEGFCLRNKYFTPYLLPKGTYGEYPETPILTLRQDFNLIAKDNVSEEFIYEFVKTAIEETDILDLNLYGKDLSKINFSMPLHEGTKRYLDKNAPQFFEKYGELLGKIGTGIGGFYTVLVALMIWRKKRKRKVMNQDYLDVLDIQAKIDTEFDIQVLKNMYSTIQEIQKNYHKLIIERKILIDDTFKMFIDVMNKNEEYLLDKITSLQLSQVNKPN